MIRMNKILRQPIRLSTGPSRQSVWAATPHPVNPVILSNRTHRHQRVVNAAGDSDRMIRMNKIQKQPIRLSTGPSRPSVSAATPLPVNPGNPVQYILNAAGDFRQDDQNEQDSEAASQYV